MTPHTHPQRTSNAPPQATMVADVKTEIYGRCIEASKRVSWEIERDVIRGRAFDRSEKYLPDGLTLIDAFTGLSETEKRFVSQIQGRTYANVFGLAERFVNAKVLEISRDHWFGDQVALEALVRFSDEELKHQALFRRIEEMIAETMPPGYRFDADPDEVARAVLDKGTWAVLALTLDIELFTQLHFEQSMEDDNGLSALFKDVFKFHWKEESQHAMLDHLEWLRHDATLTDKLRDQGVNEFIELVGAVDDILKGQAEADSCYFAQTCGRFVSDAQREAIEASFLKAYRWQYIHSGAHHPRFVRALSRVVNKDQIRRIEVAIDAFQ